jgi:magnesium-transporting ATPase (P-type)
MIILVKLLLAHFVGDFLLQPKAWVIDKEQKKVASLRLYLHVAIHGLLVFLLLWCCKLWLFAVLTAVTHLGIDVLKLYFQKNYKTKWFFIDQLLHVAGIFILWNVWFNPGVDFVRILQNPQVWIYATAIAFLSAAAGVIMEAALAKWSSDVLEEEMKSLDNAGKYIGILERLFVFLFVITGHWEGIGFLLAAKSVFRFGDLKESKDRKLTEYILIGTLLSFGFAIATGMAVRAAL